MDALRVGDLGSDHRDLTERALDRSSRRSGLSSRTIPRIVTNASIRGNTLKNE